MLFDKKCSGWMLGVAVALNSVLAGCGTPCPTSTKVENLSAERIRELSAKIGQMSAEDRGSFVKQYRLSSKFFPKQVIVKFLDSATQEKVESILKSLESTVLYRFKSSQAMLLEIPKAISDADILATVAALSELKAVEFVHPNSVLSAVIAPNDPMFEELPGLSNNGRNGMLKGADIDAPEAWQITRGSSSVVVGVIDSGIDYKHPDLSANIWVNPGESGTDDNGQDKQSNGIDDDGNGYVDDFRGWDFVSNDNDPMDDNKHGTHVAGTIGAVGNNGIGIVGVNWEVKLVGLKFLDASGSGRLSDAIRAIEYATLMNIPITNNSWGGGGYEPALEAAIRRGSEKGFLFVAAAGNDSSNNDSESFYPASYDVPNVLSVAAVDSADSLAEFSNYGASTVHVAAPGVGILSAVPGGQYARLSGTSMASPHVAGVAALIRAAFPESEHQALKKRIFYGTEPLAGLAEKVQMGRLNAQRSLETDAIPPGAVTGVESGYLSITGGQLSWKASGDDGNEGSAGHYEVRRSAEPVDSEEKWASAFRVRSLVTQEAGVVKARLKGMPLESSGFLTVRAYDNVGNASPLSRSIPFSLAKPEVLVSNDGEGFGEFRYSPAKGWGQETIEGRGRVFSDSPGTSYGPNTSAVLSVPSVDIWHPDAILKFSIKLDCESGLDWVRVNLFRSSWGSVADRMKNGLPKQEQSILAEYSARNCDWATVSIPLEDQVLAGDHLWIEFSLSTNGTNHFDGVLLDDIQILGSTPHSMHYDFPRAVTVGAAIQPVAPKLVGAKANYFSGFPGIQFPLPPGLKVDPVTGVIFGVPQPDAFVFFPMPSTFTILASDSIGVVGRATLNFHVDDRPPRISYSIPRTFVLGKAIEPIFPRSSGGAVDWYSVWPPLPDGLKLNVVTGGISGTPKLFVGGPRAMLGTASSHNIKATNSGGSATAVVRIQISRKLAP